MNALCIDLEDYYQCNDIGISYEDWPRYDSRIEIGTRIILDILDNHGVKATFFVLGDVAERNPAIVREIAEQGHEIASHGRSHRMLSELTPDEFQSELRESLRLLRELTGDRPVRGFRAASWSLTKQNRWAEAILLAEGVRYDSSVIPWKGMFHVRGDPFASLIPHSTPNGLVEFPPPVLKVAGFIYPFSLATVFRITPYLFTSWMLRTFCRRNDSPAMISIHPWDFDIDQPKLKLPLKTRLMKYTGMEKMRRKLGRLLSDYPFGRMDEVLEKIGLLLEAME